MACVEGGRHDLSSQPRGWSQAHIFGAALGGVIAQRIALRHPGRALGVTSAMALPSDGSGIGPGRLMRFGLLAKLAPTKLLVLHGDKDPILRVSAARATAIDGARWSSSPASATTCQHHCGQSSPTRSARTPTGHTLPRTELRLAAEPELASCLRHGQRGRRVALTPMTGRD